MDKEFELLKRVKAEKGEDFNDTPTRLSNDELDELLKNIIINYSSLCYDYNNNNKDMDVNEEADIIVNNIYLLLDILVKMGVHPGFIMVLLTEYNRKKVKYNDRIAYNVGRKKTNGVYFPYGDVRKELKLMKDFNYQGYNTSLEQCYDDILLMDREFSLSYSVEPTKLSKERKQAYFISITNQRNQIDNADDIIDESIYLVDLIYTSICMLVEMGINPNKILINKINEESEKGKLR